MRKHKTLPILATTALTLALAGCGNDNPGKPSKSAVKKASIATITFDNGEVLETNVLCHLESQVSAGQEILYTATSLSNPYFDLTVFGENSSFPGAKLSWHETKDFKVYQVSWSSSNLPGKSTFEPVVEVNTISGDVTLVRGEDETGEEGKTHQAKVVVNCTN